MIDLDAITDWTDEDELYCQFGVALVMNKLVYHQFQALRRVGIIADRYINPDDRILYVPLVDYLIGANASTDNVSWLFIVYINISNIFTHYTELEQIRILEILEGDFVYSLAPVSEHRWDTE